MGVVRLPREFLGIAQVRDQQAHQHDHTTNRYSIPSTSECHLRDRRPFRATLMLDNRRNAVA